MTTRYPCDDQCTLSKYLQRDLELEQPEERVRVSSGRARASVALSKDLLALGTCGRVKFGANFYPHTLSPLGFGAAAGGAPRQSLNSYGRNSVELGAGLDKLSPPAGIMEYFLRSLHISIAPIRRYPLLPLYLQSHLLSSLVRRRLVYLPSYLQLYLVVAAR